MFEKLRERAQPVLNLVAKPFTIFHPNVLSFGLFIVAAPGFYFLAQGDSLLGSLFILGAVFDGLDGTVAKLTGKTSKFGGILDATLDRVFEGLTFMFIGIGGIVPNELLFLTYIASITVSYIKAKAEATVGQSTVGKNQFSVGVGQRGDRIAILFAGLLLNGILTPENNEIAIGAVSLILILATITAVWRGAMIYKVVEEVD